MRPAADPMRSFAPYRLGRHECEAWVCYYRHDWAGVLRASVGMVREGFGMPAHRTAHGAYLVLRANMQWAPYPDNDAAAAQATMRRFYALVKSVHHLGLDPVEAARRELAWWRLHRDLQHRPGPGEPGRPTQPGEPVTAPAELTQALAALYSYVYATEVEAVRPAAQLRAEAMVISDRWVRRGCDLGDPLLVDELTALTRSYAALLAAVRS